MTDKTIEELKAEMEAKLSRFALALRCTGGPGANVSPDAAST